MNKEDLDRQTKEHSDALEKYLNDAAEKNSAIINQSIENENKILRDIIDKMHELKDMPEPIMMVMSFEPDLEPPNNFELCWGRHKILIADIKEDLPNIERLKEGRYLPVAPCMYPELPSQNGRIENNGLVLYMRTIDDPSKLNEIIENREQEIEKLEKKVRKYTRIVKYLRKLGMIP